MIAWRSRKVDALTVLLFVGVILLVCRVLAGCLPKAEDAATKAEHVVVVGSYERRLDRCLTEARAAQSLAVYDACEREATRELCASRPELRAKAICAGVSDAGQ